MEIAGTVIGLLVYHFLVGWVGSICRRNGFRPITAFSAGALSCVILALLLFAVSSVHFGEIMLLNDSLSLTILLLAGLGFLGGIRCLEHANGKYGD
jgi:hypothetical protein